MELLDRSANVVSEPRPTRLSRLKAIADGRRVDGSSSPLARLDDLYVGVRILAVFDSCRAESVLDFFRIGGGREDPRRRPFSSSMVGGLGGSGLRLDCLMVSVSSLTLSVASSAGAARFRLLTLACEPDVGFI